jgi:uncharacterized protein (TIGR03435 family)
MFKQVIAAGLAILLIAIASRAILLRAQTAPTELLTFQAASVKPTDDPRRPLLFQPGGRLVAPSVPARILITVAYGLPFSAGHGGMIGGPSWLDSQRYDVEARAHGDPTREQMAVMLQSLLAERFKLAAHWETRESPVYALVIARAGKTGPKLVPHAADDSTCTDLKSEPQAPAQLGVVAHSAPPCGGGFFVSPGHIAAESTIADLAKAMSWFEQIDRSVVDRSGLDGVFDITLDYAPYLSAADPGGDVSSSLPSTIFTALQEELGLKLEAQTGPVKVLVIDHMEQPSPN